MYYPKSQIQTNLHTNGGEFVFASNNKEYKGYYYKISKGKTYSGKSPDDPTTQLLLPLINSENSNINLQNQTSDSFINQDSIPVLEYLSIKKEQNNGLKPISFNPKPTRYDYEIGEFTRYFCKKSNELIYTEINQDTFDKLINKDNKILWQLYIPFNLNWIISGDEKKVYITNKKMVELTIFRNKLTKFDDFLKKDYLKFWKA